MTTESPQSLRYFAGQLLTLDGGVPELHQLAVLELAIRSLVESYNLSAAERGLPNHLKVDLWASAGDFKASSGAAPQVPDETTGDAPPVGPAPEGDRVARPSGAIDPEAS